MKYTVFPEVFELDKDIEFGIIIGRNLKVNESTQGDVERLKAAESAFFEDSKDKDIRQIETVKRYRDVLTKAGINPNKFTASVEAMLKRVSKGNHLPNINAMVDLCNAVSIEESLSLGGHDLRDIENDLEVRYSRNGDKFLPFGETEWEEVPEGELVFTSGPVVQTRKWVWRQSEHGKVSDLTKDVFFQIAGFKNMDQLKNAVKKIEDLCTDRFGGEFISFIVNKENPSIEF